MEKEIEETTPSSTIVKKEGEIPEPDQIEDEKLLSKLDINEIPAWSTCPFTNKMMTDPVCLISGHSYERKAIEEWFRRGHNQDPETGAKLPWRNLFPSEQLKMIIDFTKTILPDHLLKTQEGEVDINKCVDEMEIKVSKIQEKDIVPLPYNEEEMKNFEKMEQLDAEIDKAKKEYNKLVEEGKIPKGDGTCEHHHENPYNIGPVKCSLSFRKPKKEDVASFSEKIEC